MRYILLFLTFLMSVVRFIATLIAIWAVTLFVSLFFIGAIEYQSKAPRPVPPMLTASVPEITPIRKRKSWYPRSKYA